MILQFITKLLLIQSCLFPVMVLSQSFQEQIAGYWITSLPADKSIQIVLHFSIKNDEVGGSAVFLKDEKVLSKDPMQKLVANDSLVEFDLPKQGTHFSGTVNVEKLSGSFFTPNNPSLELIFHKIPFSEIPNANKIFEREASLNLLEPISYENLFDDFLILENALNTHPGIFWYSSEEKWDSLFEAGKRSIEEGMNTIDFVRLILPVIANIKCVHTNLVFDANWFESVSSQLSCFPCSVILIEEKLFIEESLPSCPIPIGSEITSINDRNASKIIEELKTFISSDGYNQSHILEEINAQFQLYFSVLDHARAFQVTFNDPIDKAKNSFRLQGMTYADWMAQNEENENLNGKSKFPISLSFKSDIPIIDINSFNHHDIEAYSRSLQDIFKLKEILASDNLIVDLRGNKGGHPKLAAELLSYFIKKPIVYLNKPKEAKSYAYLREEIHPHEHSFQGKVHFLSDGNSLSSTGHFLALVKHHKLGEIIGAIPGGSYSCFDESKLTGLPNTKLQFTVAQTLLEVDVPSFKKGEQIAPDLHFKESFTEITSGKDFLLDYTINLIRNRK